MTKKENKKIKNKKLNTVKTLIPIIGILTFIYILYKVIKLIIAPTDIFMIENGTIYDEESAIRICY